MKLEECRIEIDRIDKEIIRLLEERMDVVKDIGIAKMMSGSAVYDPEREKEKIEKLKGLTRESSQKYISEMLAEIMKQCRLYQEENKPVYGLLGRVLGHSFSPQIHRALADYEYHLFEVEPEDLGDFLTKGAFRGINVTIPYKKDVIPYCASLSDVARQSNSVNTIVKSEDGVLTGDNTDYYGLKYLLETSGFDVENKKVLVLGDGGVAGTVRALMHNKKAAEVITISRRGENNYENISRHYDAEFIINTTPLGMYPNNGVSAVEVRDFPKLTGVVDLIYNPLKTKIILDAEALGIPAEGGLKMLVGQAQKGASLFLDREIGTDKANEVHEKMHREFENIVLIGMPGCGKTTVGELLAEATSKEFVDCDELIEEKKGKAPADIIKEQGEEAFRKIETEVLADISRKSGLVIATGGGAVTVPQNLPLLRQNGKVIYLKRPLEDLPISGRPLSQAKSPETLFAERREFYESWCDLEVENRVPQDAASEIKKALGYK